MSNPHEGSCRHELGFQSACSITAGHVPHCKRSREFAFMKASLIRNHQHRVRQLLPHSLAWLIPSVFCQWEGGEHAAIVLCNCAHRSALRQDKRAEALKECMKMIAAPGGGCCTVFPFEAAIWLLEEQEELVGTNKRSINRYWACHLSLATCAHLRIV